MSKGQINNYIAPKDRALRKFVEIIDDIPLQEITIDHASRFAAHYTDLVYNMEEICRETPRKHIQNLRYIFKRLNKAKGWNQSNPFNAHDLKDLFPQPTKRSVHDMQEQRATFPTDIIRDKWLQDSGLT